MKKKLNKGLAKLLPAASKWKKTDVKPVPIPKAPLGTCLNCGAPLYGKYCLACGQRDSEVSKPYWSFMEDLSDQLVSPESRFWRTLGSLILLPGTMTRDFLMGKRARYIPPIRLFIYSIVVFFAALFIFDVAIFKLSMVPAASIFTEDDKKDALVSLDQQLLDAIDKDPKLTQVLTNLRENIAARPVMEGVSPLSITGERFRYYPNLRMFVPLGTEEGVEISDEMIEDFIPTQAAEEGETLVGEYLRRVANGFKRAAQDPRKLNNSLNIWVPRVMIIFVPMFGIFLWFFYWGKGHYLFNQLVFSLHFHSYIFVVLTFFIIAQALWGQGISMVLFLAAVPLYLFIALKVASKNGWIRTALKFSVISFFYMIGLSVMLASIFFLGLAEI